jgi:hypothetical protein
MLMQQGNVDGGSAAVLIVVYVAFVVFYLASFWRVYTKAGQPGWAAVIPIYNFIILMKIIGRPWWWILLFLVPIVNIVVLFIVYIDLAKSFGRSTGFGVGLTLLGIIFLPILAWGPATYRGPAAGAPTPSAYPPPMAPPSSPPPPSAPPPSAPPPPAPPAPGP